MIQRQCQLILLIPLVATLFLFHSSSAAELENYTYSLTQSAGGYEFWTTEPSERVFKDQPIPELSGSGVLVYAAGNESEPFQLVVRPASSGNVIVEVGDFGDGIDVEIYQVKYVDIVQATDSLGQAGPYPDPLWPLASGAAVSLTAGENTAFWINVSVATNVLPGDYYATVQVAGVTIPVTLHVFDFAISDELNVKSQMNFSHNTILNTYGVTCCGADYWMYVDTIKQMFIDHRLTPKSVLWSGGLTGSGAGPYIDYDCSTTTWTDNDGIWGFEDPAARYLDGTGLMGETFDEPFNSGTGFPSFMAATFKNNDASADQRPNSFCGSTRSAGDWYTGNNPNSAYNQKWFQYITSMENYLESQGYLDKGYYYFANEPQDQDDYDAVAWYTRYLKEAAPDLKLMVSENPRPEIFDHADYLTDGQIDIWLPVLNQYDPIISQERDLNHGEESWIYFLHGTRPPYFNPITLDHPGIESKFTGWFLWKYRIRGIAYYSLNNWSRNPWNDPMTDGHNGDLFMLYPPAENNNPIAYGSNNHRFVPSIRFELMRDSLEDYEYLHVLNNNQSPEIERSSAADCQVEKVIYSLTGYNRSSNFMYNLRRLIGMKNGGEITEIPDIAPPVGHPRAEGVPGNYFINFQDVTGEPSDDPLLVNGKTYLKIGWNEYDNELGYGWFGDMAHVMYRYLSSGPNELQKSILYDDWGRQKSFEFDLPAGTYSITVSVGWQGRTYSRHKIDIEGVSFIDDEGTTPSTPYLVRTYPVTIRDSKLTMEMGIFDEYTMLNYIDIEALGPLAGKPGDLNGDCLVGLEDALTALLVLAGKDISVDLTTDINDDESIGLAEAIFALRQAAGR